MADTLTIKRVSASPSAMIPVDALRSGGPVYSKLVDISKCIGCKGCEVACKEWNELGVEPTSNFGSIQSHKDLSPNTWLLMRFNEIEVDGDLQWIPAVCLLVLLLERSFSIRTGSWILIKKIVLVVSIA